MSDYLITSTNISMRKYDITGGIFTLSKEYPTQPFINDQINQSVNGIVRIGNYLYISHDDRILKRNIFNYEIEGSFIFRGSDSVTDTLKGSGLATDGTYLYALLYDDNYSFLYKIAADILYPIISIGFANGTGDVQFNKPAAVACDGTYLYVADTFNNRLKKHACSNLSFISKLGSYGSGNDQFSYPYGISVTSNYLFITDYTNHRVKVHNAITLAYISQTGSSGQYPYDQFNLPTGIASDDIVSNACNVWAVDRGNKRIKKYNFDTSSYALSYREGAEETFLDPDVIYYDSVSDSLFVGVQDCSEFITPIKDKVVNLDTESYSSLAFVGTTNPATPGSGNDQFNWPGSCYYDGTHVYVPDFGNDRIVKRLASDLSYVSQIGSSGSGDDQFNGPISIVGDSTYIYITDTGNNRIVKRLKSDLSYVTQIGSLGTGDDQFNFPYCIAIDGTYLYITDSLNNRIHKRLCSDLSYVSKIGSAGSGNDQFSSPTGIAYAGGYIYVCDFYNNRVHKRSASTLAYVTQHSLSYADMIGTDGTFLYTTSFGNSITIFKIAISGFGGGGLYTSYSSNLDPSPSTATLGVALKIPIDFNDNNIFITDTHYVEKREKNYFTQLGEFSSTQGSEDYQLNNPQSITSDGSYVYVTDTNNHRILKYDISDYSLIDKIGTQGSGNDQFYYPSGIATDGTYLYVGDSLNDRIVKRLASDLSYVSQIGSSGSGDDQFNLPRRIATDNTYIYIVDTNNHRIHKRLCSDLSYVSKIGTQGSGDDQFQAPEGIATDGTNVYVADTNNHRIHKRLCSDLSYVSQIGTQGTGDSQFQYPSDVSLDITSTYLYVADSNNHRIKRHLISDLSYSSYTLSTGAYVAGIYAVSRSGSERIYATHPTVFRVLAISSSFVLLNDFPASKGAGTVSKMLDVTSDGNDIFVCDEHNHRIQKRDIDTFQLIAQAGDGYAGFPGGNNSFNSPKSITCDGTYLYVADTGFHRIKKHLVSDMSYVAQSGGGSAGSGDAYFNYPCGVATDGTYVYVADTYNSRIKKYDTDLVFISKYGTQGSGDDQLSYPFGITTDGVYLYICDTINNRIVKRLCSDLSYVSKIGTQGSGDDQFYYPMGISTDGTNLYVADFVNNRIVKRLTSDLSYVAQYSVSNAYSSFILHNFVAPSISSLTPGKRTIQINLSGNPYFYNIYWGNSAGVTKGTGTKIQNVSSAYVHTDLEKSKTYYYVTTAGFGGLESTESSEDSDDPLFDKVKFTSIIQ